MWFDKNFREPVVPKPDFFGTHAYLAPFPIAKDFHPFSSYLHTWKVAPTSLEKTEVIQHKLSSVLAFHLHLFICTHPPFSTWLTPPTACPQFILLYGTLDIKILLSSLESKIACSLLALSLFCPQAQPFSDFSHYKIVVP